MRRQRAARDERIRKEPAGIRRHDRRDGRTVVSVPASDGYADRADAWMNTGTLVSRLNFALVVAANGMNAASLDIAREQPGAECALLCNERVAGRARDGQRRPCEQARFPDLRTDDMPMARRRAASTTLSERRRPPIFDTRTLISQRAGGSGSAVS